MVDNHKGSTAPAGEPAQNTIDEEEESFSGAELRHVWRFLFPYLGVHPGPLTFIAAILLFEGAFNAAFSLSLKFLIDDAFLSRNGRLLVCVLIALAISGAAVSLAGLLGDFLQAKIFAQVVTDIRLRLFDHLQTLATGFFSRSSSGAILSRFSGDVLSIERALASAIPWCLLPLVEAGFSIFFLILLNLNLSVAALLVLPLTVIGPKLFANQTFVTGFQKRTAEGLVLSSTQESIQAHSLIKAFGLETWSRTWFNGFNYRLLLTQRRFLFRLALVERSASISTLLMHLVVVSFGAFLTFHGKMSIGTLVAFESIFLSMCYAVTYITQYFPTIAEAAGAIRHIKELLDEQSEIADPQNAFVLPKFAEVITFRDVSFSYAKPHPVLRDISFQIPKNSFVAFVGNSGSGKTTVLNLLQRSYDPDCGTVSIDGHDLRSLNMKAFRRRIGIVFQESFLFNLTIRENISFGDLTATQEQIESAARAAEIHDFIVSIPNGYESTVGERGVQLSGGQRQRIAIARAILRDPDVLLLDEATSALDGPTEASIRRTLMKLTPNRTVIAVTHRLPLVVDAHQIFVLSAGRLVETGTHEELLQRHGAYRELWSHQHDSASLKPS